VKHRKLYLDCLRRSVEAHQHGTLNRWEAVACMATCIDIAMRENPAEESTGPEVRDAAAVPALELDQPLNAGDQILQELYLEATTFWAAGYGKLRLVK
jgi:hypothetical protein